MCVDVCGCVWICVDMCRCVWMCVDVCGCVWMCVDVYGCVWMCMDVLFGHFQSVCLMVTSKPSYFSDFVQLRAYQKLCF